MKLLHHIVVSERAVAADGTERVDLGVHPTSVLLLNIRPLNDTGTLANFASYRAICSAVNRITVEFNGASLFSMRGEDAAAIAYFRHGVQFPQANHDDLNNDRRCVTLPIHLGRFAYDVESCFPASRRGELQLTLDFDVADTGYDGMRYNVESIELVGASPKEFERKIDRRETFAATGDNDVELPVGNRLRGVLAFGTTGYAGGSPAPTLGRMRIEVDGEEASYTAIDFETAHGLSSLMGRQPARFDNHTHRVTTDGNAQTELETLAGAIEVGADWNQYAYLDLDPTRDDMFSLDLSRSSRVLLRVDAESADAVRVVTVEKVKL